MALDIGAIREALAAQVNTKLKTSTLPANVQAYPDQSPPLNAVLIEPRPYDDGKYITYHGTMANALCTIGLRLEIRCGGTKVDAEKAMDLYLSAGNAESVLDALAANTTLNGLIEDIYMEGGSVPAWFAPSEGDTRVWLSSFIDLQVRARR